MTAREESTEGRRDAPLGRGKVPLHVAAALLGLWILLSGKLDAFHLGVGVASVVLVAWNHTRLQEISGLDRPHVRPLRLLVYAGWLFWQMMASSVYVARVILRPKAHLDPQLIAFRSEQPSVLTSVIFANSITLTPGTITADLEDNRYVVHALTPVTAKDLLEGGMAARVAKLASDDPVPPPEELPPDEAPVS